jgi:ubiquinone/menaquinone biosynthesis C-methylase UbiE
MWLGVLSCGAAFAQANPPAAQVNPLKEENQQAVQRARQLIHEMALKPGMTVADLNTGLGFMLPFLSRNVGPDGHVIAEDSSADMLLGARQLAENQSLANVEFVKGSDTDPNLPEGKLDVVLALDVYHRLAAPEKMLAAIYRSLKPDGRLAIVEHYKRDAAEVGTPFAGVKFDMPDLIRELEANRFHVVEEKEQVKDVQYILILEKK